MPRLQRNPLGDQVYKALHERLARGELGERLTETRLAAELGISRTPVREALHRLRQEGLLDATPRGKSLARLERADLEEILEMRTVLEPFIAARAAERGAAEPLARLRRALQQEVDARSVERFAQANQEFRIALLEMCGNRRLADTARRLDGQIQPLRRATLAEAENRAVVVRHHRKLAAALGRRDAREAERVMAELMERARVATLALK
jgi:GntR family transcriptional regulator, rspAB operon transcriptional repressor